MEVANQEVIANRRLAPKQSIASLHVLSSGWAEQHKEHRFGSVMPRMWWVLTSRSWVSLPINYFLIEHKDGLVLFDTGVDPAITTDKFYISSALGRWLLRRIFRFYVSDDDQLDKILANANCAASAIRKAVISHLHFDHVGGVQHIPQAELIVSEREWSQLSEPHPEREWVLSEHIQIPNAKWRPFKFEATDNWLFDGFDGIFDVAGDGSMILLPTPGHTVGSISMLIRNAGWAPMLLVGDLTYDGALLESGTVPGTGDKKTLLSSYENVRKLKEKLPDLVIVPSHDYGARKNVAAATQQNIN